jgi:hypothetical protein
MSSPFCSSRYRRKIGYGPRHFFDELNEGAKKILPTESGDDDDSISSGISGSSSSSDSDDDTPTVNTSSMMISRSASLKFVDDMFAVDLMKMQKSISYEDDGELVSYDGVPKEQHYFGEDARNRFFLLFNRYIDSVTYP